MKSGTLMALSFAASIGILLCGYAAGRYSTDNSTQTHCVHVQGYQVLPTMDTLYVTSTGGDTIGEIPYTPADSLWSIVIRDNE